MPLDKPLLTIVLLVLLQDEFYRFPRETNLLTSRKQKHYFFINTQLVKVNIKHTCIIHLENEFVIIKSIRSENQ